MDKIIISIQENTNSEIIIKENSKESIGDFFDTEKSFLITNTTLAKLYPNFLKQFKQNRIIIIKDGEKYKNIKTYEYILNELLKNRIERKNNIVAFGGGVVGDLAGFVASTILRGVKLIQIPTTLLAMCDSSIGGKTGFNNAYGKNLIGSFYCADKIIIDSTFLKTLNEYELKCGLGEVLKYAFIEKSCDKNSNYNLLDLLKNYDYKTIKQNINQIITICVNLKAIVVNNDRLESGLRKILNFGHTYAHPIETLSNYKNISHGEAVAYGMECASRLALIKKLIDEKYYSEIISLIDKYELISKKIKFKKNDIINLMFQDKKVENSKINLLLPTAQGFVELFDNIDLPSIEASLP